MKFFPHFVVVGFSNSYLVAGDDDQAVIVDPGRFDGMLLNLIESNRLTIQAVLVTHSHESHVAGIKTLLRIYDANVFAFRDRIFDIPTTSVRNGEIIRCGTMEIKVIETPGHSRDSVVYKIGNLLFTGDTLTAGLTGTTPHEHAHSLILSSIRKNILPLGDDLMIFPGHGPPSRVGLERKYNVILNEAYPRSRSSAGFF